MGLTVQGRVVSNQALAALFCAALINCTNIVPAAAEQSIAQVPLSLATGVPANIIVTLDDSERMQRGYLPDKTAASYRQIIDADGSTASRRFRAATSNPLYYNPHTTYQIPPAFNQHGEAYNLTTSFTHAAVNGFAATSHQTAVDLSSDYRVVAEQPMPSGDTQYAPHPKVDFSCTINEFISNGTQACIGQITFNITRQSAASCSATAVLAGVEQAVDCVMEEGTATARVNNEAGVPAYYYEFAEEFDDGLCAGRQAAADAGGEHCYQLRWVDQASAYAENGQRLINADGSVVDGRRNFAIWYSFYKTRALAALSAISMAMDKLPSEVRVTWQSVSACQNFVGTDGASCQNNALKSYSAAHKGQFYRWLSQLAFNAQQPLADAMIRTGEYLTTAQPWLRYLDDAGANSSANTYACRPNYHVLITDGMADSASASDYPSQANFRADETAFTLPDGQQYAHIRPYFDPETNTLADLAMHYWATDAQPSLANKVPRYTPLKHSDAQQQYWHPRNNPATWQHLRQMIMGLGLSRILADSNLPWAGSTHAGPGYSTLSSGQANWPKTRAYDLWHAAINSRGELYSVENPAVMGANFKQLLRGLAQQNDAAVLSGITLSLEAKAAVIGATEPLSTYLYQSSFNSAVGWSGDLQKIKQNSQGITGNNQVLWSASSQLPAASERNIMIAGTGVAQLQAFTPNNAGLPAAPFSLAYYLKQNPEPDRQVATWQQRLAYIRGEQSHEGEGVANFRPRATMLADFIHSQPVRVSGARYLPSLANRLESNSAYTDFAQSLQARQPMLYIGGNAGMLHGFNSDSGEETFAFIPTAVFPKLHQLTGHNYSHQYYVDGTPVVADIYADGQWRTILVGSLRAGGKGLFALDITDPAQIKLLWELDDSSPALQGLGVKLGYSFPQPSIARLHSGQWAVVTGNGYQAEGSDRGAAALYVLDAFSGALIKSLEVQSPLRQPNGLSTPRLADYDADGVADYAYAGDLHGNLWRFDLLGDGALAATESPLSHGHYGAKNGSSNQFKVAYGAQPMFSASSTEGAHPQAITAAPSLIRHPSRHGYLVVFGSGRYFTAADKIAEQNYAHTIYGIWDRQTQAQPTDIDTVTRGQLQAQYISSQANSTSIATAQQRQTRSISLQPVEWHSDFDSSQAVKQRGWYLDLEYGGFTGEMLVEEMRSLGSMLLFKTLIPNQDPCSSGTEHWLYAIDPNSGGRMQQHIFKDVAGETIEDNIEPVSAIEFGTEAALAVSYSAAGLTLYAPEDEAVIELPITEQGRQTWRRVPD